MKQSRDERGRFLPLSESTATLESSTLVEKTDISADTLREAQGPRRKVTIIESGWGSSGYYGEDILREFGATAWPAGTPMYLDHPSKSEEFDRPERSVKDLAGRIVSDPVLEEGSLVAEAEIYPHWASVVDALADDIGLSIRAGGELQEGKAEGKNGLIVQKINEYKPGCGHSVDLVTEAGAGGRIGELIESARETKPELEEARNAAHWFEAKIHSHFTDEADWLFQNGHLTREERIALSSAIGASLESFASAVADSVPQLLTRDPYAELTESAAPAASQKEDEMSDEDKRQLSELQETVRQHETRLQETERQRDEFKERAERAEDKILQNRARSIVSEAVSGVQGLPKRAHDRVIESVLRQDVPVDGDGEIKQEALTEAATKAAEDEREYLQEGSTSGRVSGMGGGDGLSDGSNGSAPSPEQLEASFQRLGMSESAAKVAAEGR